MQNIEHPMAGIAIERMNLILSEKVSSSPSFGGSLNEQKPDTLSLLPTNVPESLTLLPIPLLLPLVN